MNLVIINDYDALSRAGADWVAEAVDAKPDAAIVVATGETPMGIYRELAERRSRGLIDTSRLRVFELDAYLGLVPDDRRSLFGWTRRSFLEPLGIAEANVVRLAGDAPDPWEASRAYEAAAREAGGFDISILGLGPNGHLGFNEPPSPPDAPTRVVDLTPESIASNARYWGGEEQVPRRALTCGMDLLLAARRTLLVVSGAHKHQILHRAVEGPQTPEVPASYLQEPSDVTVLADRAAWHGPELQ
ncbi:MAG TPA: glucosamine-6-phosphate deaminase [Anaerolineales bacterium]|nr:glucosamine-6-phosphate deaminase [Anaerolineales bacterium]